jgi:hypothetical protein
VDLRSLAHAMADRSAAREKYLPLFRPALEAPAELVRSRDLQDETAAEREAREAAGRPRAEKWRKKSLKYFADPDAASRMLLVTAEETPEGWLAWNFIPAEMHRRGLRQWRIGLERLWPPRRGDLT